MNNTIELTDGYKLDHRNQYPIGTSLVYSTFTPRYSMVKGIQSPVFFGLNLFIQKYFIEGMTSTFFDKNEEVAVEEYQNHLNDILGPNNGVGTEHIRALHRLGYLPIEIRALAEGIATPVGVAQFTVCNTHKEFAWLTNYFETAISASIWQPCASATIAREYRKIMDRWMRKTDEGNMDFVDWQAHDFSMRGMSSLETSISSALGHLTSFKGTDVFPAIAEAKYYYNTMTLCTTTEYATKAEAEKTVSNYLEEFFEYEFNDSKIKRTEPVETFKVVLNTPENTYLISYNLEWIEKDGAYRYIGVIDVSIEPYTETIVGGTIKASEHAVMCANAAGSEDDEYDSYKRLITEVYPSGPIALVSDTYDFYKVLTETVPRLKEEILARDGSVCFRGDSADPADILCGSANFQIIEDEWVTDEDKLIAWCKDGKSDEINKDLSEDPNICGYDTQEEYVRALGNTYKVTYEIELEKERGSYSDNSYYTLEEIHTTLTKCTDFTPEQKGAVEILWDIFGGTINAQGYKVLDPHVKASFGEAINLDKSEEIFQRLADKGFASSNIVLGVGSFGYGGAQTFEGQQVIITRDTFGCAIKAVYTEITNEDGSITCNDIFKKPKTGDGKKASARGKIMVYRDEEGNIKQKDQCTWEEANSGLLEPVFLNGRLLKRYTLDEIRETIKK